MILIPSTCTHANAKTLETDPRVEDCANEWFCGVPHSDTHVRMLEDYIQETIFEQNKLAAGSDRSVSDDIWRNMAHPSTHIGGKAGNRSWTGRQSTTGHTHTIHSHTCT